MYSYGTGTAGVGVVSEWCRHGDGLNDGTAARDAYFVNISTGQSSWTLPNGAQLDKHVQQHRVQQHRAAGRLARVDVHLFSR